MTVLLTPLPQGRNAALLALSQGCNCVTSGSIPETPRRKAKRVWQTSRSARSKINSQGSEEQHKPTKSVCSAFTRFPDGLKAAETRLCRIRDIVFRGEKPNGRKIFLSAFAAAGDRVRSDRPAGRERSVLFRHHGKLNESAAVFCGSEINFSANGQTHRKIHSEGGSYI